VSGPGSIGQRQTPRSPEALVVGFDDLPECVLVEPHHATVRQPIPEKGFEAAALLD